MKLRRRFNVKHYLRRAPEPSLVKIPHKSADTVSHAVAQKYPYGVFTLFELVRDIISVVIYNIVDIAAVWRQKAFCDVFAVYIYLVKSEPGYNKFSLVRYIGKLERSSEIRSGYMFVPSGNLLPGFDDEASSLLFTLHCLVEL